MPAMWAGVAASVVGGLMSKSSASKAAKQQTNAAREAQAVQERMYQQTREDLAPYRDTGSAANARLSFLLGLEGGGNPAIGAAQQRYDAAQAAYERALNSGGGGQPQSQPRQYTNDGGHYEPSVRGGPTTVGAKVPWQHDLGVPYYEGNRYPYGGGSGGSGADLSSYTAELDAARQALADAQGAPWQTPAGYGSLLDKYTGQDLYDDPSYHFRLNEGYKARENSAAARGMQLSTGQQKALDRYGQEFASTEFGAARNRFVGDQDQTYNYLTGPTQRGLQASGMAVNAGQNFANAQSSLYGDIGNAQSAGTVAGGNALTSGINSAYNTYQNDRLMEMLRTARK